MDQSHATNSQTQSAVPNAIQKNAPEGVERALPDSVSSPSYCFISIADHLVAVHTFFPGLPPPLPVLCSHLQPLLIPLRSTTPTPTRTLTSRTLPASRSSPRRSKRPLLRDSRGPFPMLSTTPVVSQAHAIVPSRCHLTLFRSSPQEPLNVPSVGNGA
jgi:hypothetical protein